MNRQPLTNGLVSVGMYARGKFCGNLQVLRPSERQAVRPLCAMPREWVADSLVKSTANQTECCIGFKE